MGMMKAAVLAPEACCCRSTSTSTASTRASSRRAVREIAPIVEDRGVDEIYIDLTEMPGAQLDSGRAAARH
jgi:DNA polymerase-4